jgi:hypothetical protein
MLCNNMFSAVIAIGVWNCSLLHGDRIMTAFLTLMLLLVVCCLSYCPKDSHCSTEFMYWLCMQTNKQLDDQCQLYFFRQYFLLSNTCYMFWLFHKVIIRHKHKNVKEISTLYTEPLLLKKDWDLSFTVAYILIGLFFY